ncbi:MAG: hypothetical protein A2W91_01060 [Bacteroidetes bacterium GWF2_38_335]|nr:MAG: hypothetical protein A2W91_01060 [Bacteroidetes bacterium GWF2_38_335]OFY80343.1 MAG: hypothetical protein A2281_17570 [Bacteroidetes bacterium RIFOXYA12_FULL_38_20]HBS88856.1 hypothetical protein [Bacteroidales bacterium]
MEYLIDLTLVFLLSTVKFAFAFPFAAISLRLNFHEILFTTSTGGIAGVFFFAYLTKPFMRLWKLFLNSTGLRKEKIRVREPKKVNYKRFRRVIKLKRNYGLFGLALFTPIIISIPVGTFIAVRFFNNSRKTLIMLVSFVLVWSIVLSYIITSLDGYYEYFTLW